MKSISCSPETTFEAFIRNHEKAIITFITIIASLRVFFFSAAFPFFNNVDEPCHFDLVYRFSSGQMPKSAVETFSREAAEIITLYGSPEYFSTPEKISKSGCPSPLWLDPYARGSRIFKRRFESCQKLQNHEAGSFLLPYALAGSWCKIGRLFGIGGGNLLYWIRFLNIPIFALLTCLSWYIARTFFPSDQFQRLSLPLLIAFFPQDLFYAITNDNLSSLFFALSFFLLLQIYLKEKSYGYFITTGFAVGFTFLAKISNLVILIFMALIIILKIRKLSLEKQLKKHLPRLVSLLVFATIPIGIQFIINYLAFNDLTGITEVMKYKGWTTKTFGELWNHPIFTFEGVLFFMNNIIKTFWRGEFVWHGKRMAFWCIDLFYLSSTGIFLLASFFYMFSKDKKNGEPQRFVLSMSFCVIVISILFLVFLSIRFDFGNHWFYPSRGSPYFTSGRLISGILVPFIIIYINGLKFLLFKINGRINPFIAILAILILISCSEILLSYKVFGSAYNWYHLD